MKNTKRAARVGRELKAAKREIRFLQTQNAELEELRKRQKETYDKWQENKELEHQRELEKLATSAAKEKAKLQKHVNDIENIKLGFEKNQSRSNRVYHEIQDLVHILIKKVESVSPEALQAKHAQLSNEFANYVKKNPGLLNQRLQ